MLFWVLPFFTSDRLRVCIPIGTLFKFYKKTFDVTCNLKSYTYSTDLYTNFYWCYFLLISDNEIFEINYN